MPLFATDDDPDIPDSSAEVRSGAGDELSVAVVLFLSRFRFVGGARLLVMTSFGPGPPNCALTRRVRTLSGSDRGNRHVMNKRNGNCNTDCKVTELPFVDVLFLFVDRSYSTKERHDGAHVECTDSAAFPLPYLSADSLTAAPLLVIEAKNDISISTKQLLQRLDRSTIVQ